MHRPFSGRGSLRSDACDFGILCPKGKDSISSKDGFAPFLLTFFLDVDPDADIRITLVLASEVSGNEVALLGFYDSGSMALWEAGLLI